ncbi:MAG: hypothetical protein LC632_09290 [Xanthomonadaceae bacterium]|nr:hypothetical protein [Xanthomonadaceae bacterium]
MKNKIFAAIAAAGLLVSAGAHADAAESNLGAATIATAPLFAVITAPSILPMTALAVTSLTFAAFSHVIIDRPRPLPLPTRIDPPGPAFPAFPPPGGGGDTPPTHTPVSHH